MFARPGLAGASSCSSGSSAQRALASCSSQPTPDSGSTPSSGAKDAGRGPATVTLAAGFQNVGQVARVLAHAAQAQATLHAQGELPGDVDLAAMVHLAQDMTAALRAIQERKASIRRRATPRACPPAAVPRRRRPTRAPKRCVECCTAQTPEWRSGPQGPRSLCNVCGLLYAKHLRDQRQRAG